MKSGKGRHKLTSIPVPSILFYAIIPGGLNFIAEAGPAGVAVGPARRLLKICGTLPIA